MPCQYTFGEVRIGVLLKATKSNIGIITFLLILGFTFPDPAEASPIPVPIVYADPIVAVPEARPLLKAMDTKKIDKYQQMKTMELKEPPVPPRVLGQGANGPNTYMQCQCTDYAKRKRPDLPGTLGNANTWAVRAKAMGWNVGTKPAPGAIGVDTSGPWGHVVYVEAVNGDSVTISEWNYKGPCVLSQRTVPASAFTYIY